MSLCPTVADLLRSIEAWHGDLFEDHGNLLSELCHGDLLGSAGSPSMAPKSSKYQNTFWHAKSKTWVVTVRGAHVASSKNEDAAAALAAAKLGTPIKLRHVLRQRRCKGRGDTTTKRSKYRGLVWDRTRKAWKAQVTAPEGKKSLFVASGPDENAVAAKLAERLGVEVSSICLEAQATETSPQAQQQAATAAAPQQAATAAAPQQAATAAEPQQAARPRASSASSSNSPSPWDGRCQAFLRVVQHLEPGDLDDLKRRAMTGSPSWTIPLLRTISVSWKYGPARSCLEEMWLSQNLGHNPSDAAIYKTILLALKELEGRDLSTWTKCCSARGTGYLVESHAAGVFCGRGGGRKMVLGGGDGKDYFVRRKPSEKFICWVNLQRERSGLIERALRDSGEVGTLAWWRIAVSKLVGPYGAAAGGCYCPLWQARSILVGHMAACGVSRLQLPSGAVSLLDFAAVFPDRRGWIWQLGQQLETRSIQELLERLQFRAGPEYFSMFLCLVGQAAPMFRETHGSFEPAERWLQAALLHRQNRGIFPSPFVLLRLL